MMILAIETTGPLASVALIDEESNIIQSVNKTSYSHLEELAPMIKSILQEQNLSKDDVEAIAVSRGPGSFTGVRIGMATAKALAYVWDKPILEVPTLKSFAFTAENKTGEIICPLFDARRSQVYAAAFRLTGQGCADTIIQEGAFDINDFIDLLKAKVQADQKVIFFGDGIQVYQAALSEWKGPFEFAPEHLRFQTADRIALLGRRMYSQGITVDAFSAKPEYLRQSEAERKLIGK